MVVWDRSGHALGYGRGGMRPDGVDCGDELLGELLEESYTGQEQGREEDALVRLVLGALLDAYQTS